MSPSTPNHQRISRHGPRLRTRNGAKNEALVAELQQLMTLPGNDVCADCPNKCPDWAPVNLDITCMKCSGIHRNLGTHISKVALWTDRWNSAQVGASETSETQVERPLALE